MRHDIEHALRHLQTARAFIQASGMEIPKATVRDFERLTKRLRKQTERLARAQKRLLEDHRARMRKGMKPYQNRPIPGLGDLNDLPISGDREVETVTLAAGMEEPKQVLIR